MGEIHPPKPLHAITLNPIIKPRHSLDARNPSTAGPIQNYFKWIIK